MLDLAEEWFLNEADAPLLYTLLRLGPQPWSGLRLRSKRVKIRSAISLPVIIFFLDFLIFGF
jgi:hypothetical protein